MIFFKKLNKDKKKGGIQSITILQIKNLRILDIEKTKVYPHSDKNPLIILLIGKPEAQKYLKKNINIHKDRYRNRQITLIVMKLLKEEK